jgi:acetyl esterase
VPCRLYVPERADDPLPLLVYFHGGGHTIGSLESADSVCRLLGAHAGVAVLSVDYRMGPEHRFPAAVEDSLAAFDFAVAEAAELGVDPDRVAVGGDSAGGNLAGVVAQQRRGADGAAPAFQLLIYPVCDLTAERRSRELFAQGFLLTRQGIAWYRDHYMGPDGDRSDPRVSILLTEGLADVAPAYVATAGFDPLRDEGEEYARRLSEAGNVAAVRRHPGLVHGFANMTGFGLDSRDAVLEMAGALRLGLAVRGRAAPR